MKKWLVLAAVIVGLLAFSAIVWFALPLIAFGDTVPFDSWLLRLVIILVAWLIVGLIYAWRIWRARRGARKIEEGLLKAAGDDGDSKVLAERMGTALQTLKASTGKRDFLYDLPWYIIIGPPGAGKTTALLKSGLKFPLAGADGGASIAGTGGTRYCDWWFTEEAVLIDTAGRYTTHDSDAESDKKSWLSFLALLKRFRSRQPINGVIVAISLQDVMTMSPSDLAAHSTAIRTRLIEVHQQLKIDFPVYALFTKADLVVGFNEYFGNFTESRRRKVWGATFQTEDRKKNLIGTVPAEFDLLVKRLTEELPDRLQEEPDAISRIATFGFPAQVAMLKDKLFDFLRQIFEPNRYQVNANLRGFYFSSGTQEGTPIDQVLGAMDRSFGAAGQGLRQMSGLGKSYFLHDLITKVIFSETGWVSMDIRAVRRAQGIRYGAMTAITLATVLLLGAWSYSFVNNRQLLKQTDGFISDYKVSAAPFLNAPSVSDTDLVSVLPVLDQLRDNPVGYANRNASTPWNETFGLSQRDRLVEASSVSYRGALERMFRSRLILRLEAQLNASTDDPLASYEALKVYLMLGGKAPKTDVDFIVDWMKQDWANNLYPGPQNSSARDDLETHLRAMLALDVARKPSFELNGLLVDSVQRTLTRLSLSDQAYAYLKTAVPDVPLEDFNVAARAGPESADVFETADGSDFNALAVPALFTYGGFQNFFLPHLASVAEQLAGEAWVRGDAGKQVASEDQLRQLGPQLLQLYSKDFVANWNKVLGNIRLKRLPGDKPDYPTLAIISNPQTSPLGALVKAIVSETQLTKDATPDAGGAAPGLPGAPKLPGNLGALGADVKNYEAQQLAQRSSGLARIGIGFALNKSSGRPGDAGGPGGGAPAIPGADVEAQFKNYALLLDGTPSAIDTVLSGLNDIYKNQIISDRDATQKDAAVSAIQLDVSNLGYNASRFPPPIHAIIDKASQDLEGSAASTNLAQLNAALGSDVTQACKQLTQNLYPFSPSSKRDLPMGDFARLFAPNGILDKFFAEKLNTYVDRSAKLWAWKQDDPLAAQLSVDALRQFQRAADIRDAFFPPNSQVPSVTLTVSPMTLNAAADTATLNIDGTSIVSQQVGSVPATLQWPSATGTGAVSLTLAPDMPGRPSTFTLDGPWSLMHFFNLGSVSQSGGAMRATFVLGGRDVSYRIQVNTLANPFFLPALTQFSCPTGL